MNEQLKRFDNKKVLLAGGNESIGVPCSVYNKNRIGFMEIVAKQLINYGIDLEVVNMFSMVINKNWHIDEIIKHNLSLYEIKNMKKTSITVNRKNLFNKIFLPKGLQKLDEPTNNDKDKRITDMIKAYENVIFFYQSGSNNLMYDMQANPMDSVLNKNMRNRALELMKDNKIINRVITQMDKNINNLLSVNNAMELYVLGLYAPKLFSGLSKYSDGFKLMLDFIERFNFEVECLAKNNMVKYVDITSVGDYCAMFGIDIHCTQEGHEHLANIALENIINNKNEVLHVPNQSLKIDNMGLNGMIEDGKRRLENYQKASLTGNYENTILSRFADSNLQTLCNSLKKEHEKEIEVYKLAKQLKGK